MHPSTGNPSHVPHVAVIGAGFGGMYVARRLAPHVRAKRLRVTVLNRTNYFLFTPMLHEVATGGLGPTSVIEPLREILSGTGIDTVQADAVTLDAVRREVKTSTCTLGFDAAVVATGAVTDFRDVPGTAEHALGLKTLADAVRIRERIIDAFEMAAVERDPSRRQGLLTFVIVGGGATGVEVAGELADFVSGIANRYHRADLRELVAVHLVHAGGELLPFFPRALRHGATERLRHDGVAIHFNTTVASVSGDGLELVPGGRLPAHTVIWCAGVKPLLPVLEGIQTVKGRIPVDVGLAAAGTDGIFALGDAAAAPAGLEWPQLAQVAVAQADVAADNVLARFGLAKPRTFTYRSRGALVSVGQWFAVGEIFSAALRGRFAWWIWRTVYLFKFFSWRKRLRIAFEWTVNLFYPRDISKLS